MLIYGINAVTEALRAGRVVSMRAGRRKDQRLQQLLTLAEQLSVPVRRVPDDELDRESGGSSHQGVIADVSERKIYELHDLIADAYENLMFKAYSDFWTQRTQRSAKFAK